MWKYTDGFQKRDKQKNRKKYCTEAINTTKKIKKYTILRKIGKGYNALGYVVSIDGTSNEYFLKISKDKKYRDRYGEVKLNPSVKTELCAQSICAEYGLCVPVVDWWMCSEGKVVIVSPLLKNTLYEELGIVFGGKSLKFKKSPEEMWDTFKKVLVGVNKLHNLGMGYGDLHWGNIMFDENRNIKFIDMETIYLFLEGNSHNNSDYYTLVKSIPLRYSMENFVSMYPIFKIVLYVAIYLKEYETTERDLTRRTEYENKLIEDITSKTYEEIKHETKNMSIDKLLDFDYWEWDKPTLKIKNNKIVYVGK